MGSRGAWEGLPRRRQRRGARGNVHGHRDLPEQGQTRSQVKLWFKIELGGGGKKKKILQCGRSKRIKTCRSPRSSQKKRKTGGFAQVLGFMVGAEVTAAMTRQACGALLHARLCSTDQRDRPGKPQTLCLPSLCIPLLLCCSDGFKNNWECPLGLRLWDKSDPPAAREKFTKYPWLKIIP